MNVLQLHDESWDSGLSHYALTLSAALEARGHRVRFWAAAGSDAARRGRELGLSVREIQRPWLSLPALRRELAELGVEVVNAHTGSAHSLAAALCAGSRVPVVRTRGDARAPAGHALARALARRTRLFIAANARLAAQLSRAFPGARVETVPQGLAVPPSAPPLPDSPVTGVLGRLDPVKGHEDWLRAAALVRDRLPAARHLAAGADTSGRLGSLKSLAGSLGLGDQVEFLGFVPEAQAFIARCRVGVVASRGSEAVSRAALEWMSFGRPVVATRVGGLPDLVEDGVTGLLVPAGEPQALAIALRELLSEPAHAERMGAKGRERFERLFGLESFAARTESLYAELLREARA